MDGIASTNEALVMELITSIQWRHTPAPRTGQENRQISTNQSCKLSTLCFHRVLRLDHHHSDDDWARGIF